MSNKCTGCTRRREIIKDAYRQSGVTGVIKSIPNVIRTVGTKEPNIRTRKWPK